MVALSAHFQSMASRSPSRSPARTTRNSANGSKSARKPHCDSFLNNGRMREARGADPRSKPRTRAEEKGEDQKEKSPPRFPPESPHHLISTCDVAISDIPVKSRRFGGRLFVAFSRQKQREEPGKLWAATVVVQQTWHSQSFPFRPLASARAPPPRQHLKPTSGQSSARSEILAVCSVSVQDMFKRSKRC